MPQAADSIQDERLQRLELTALIRSVFRSAYNTGNTDGDQLRGRGTSCTSHRDWHLNSLTVSICCRTCGYRAEPTCVIRKSHARCYEQALLMFRDIHCKFATIQDPRRARGAGPVCISRRVCNHAQVISYRIHSCCRVAAAWMARPGSRPVPAVAGAGTFNRQSHDLSTQTCSSNAIHT